MLGVHDLATYVLGALAIVLLPGPNSLYVLSVAARKGIRTGYRAACGVFLGDLVLISLTALGAASLLRANPAVFAVVRFGGAAYLLWIGYGMLRAARQMWRERALAAAPAEDAVVEDGERPFRRALMISLFNPKAILFLLSLVAPSKTGFSGSYRAGAVDGPRIVNWVTCKASRGTVRATPLADAEKPPAVPGASSVRRSGGYVSRRVGEHQATAPASVCAPG
ncbi:leucine efflux protein LeuE [Kitasatospora cineracea]|uniref:leucine efflux protein LeuE n=1 Tax=Kitasatospora cineracea TaxID=88074 RepID=UPI00380434E8